MKATILKTKISEKHYGKIKVHTVYDVAETGRTFNSGAWTIAKIKNLLKSQGFTSIEVSEGEPTKMNY